MDAVGCVLCPDGRTGTLISVLTTFAFPAVASSSGLRFTPAATLLGACFAASVEVGAFAVPGVPFGLEAGVFACGGAGLPLIEERREEKDCLQVSG